MHENKIVYRDLKCQNVLLNRNGEPKLTDFDCTDSSLSKPQTNGVGTASNSPPEYYSNGGERTECYGTEGDCWVLGVLTHRLLTFVYPFGVYHDDDIVQVHQKHQNPDRQLFPGRGEYAWLSWYAGKPVIINETVEEGKEREIVAGTEGTILIAKDPTCVQVKLNDGREVWLKKEQLTPQEKKSDLRLDEDFQFTNEAKDFVECLLTMDPKDRLDIQGVLNHKWLADAPETCPYGVKVKMVRLNHILSWTSSRCPTETATETVIP